MTTTLAQIASRAVQSTAAHHLEHTTAAVHELARIYGFDASEALQKLQLASTEEQQESALRFALHATVHHRPPTLLATQKAALRIEKQAIRALARTIKAAEKTRKAAEKTRRASRLGPSHDDL